MAAGDAEQHATFTSSKVDGEDAHPHIGILARSQLVAAPDALVEYAARVIVCRHRPRTGPAVRGAAYNPRPSQVVFPTLLTVRCYGETWLTHNCSGGDPDRQASSEYGGVRASLCSHPPAAVHPSAGVYGKISACRRVNFPSDAEAYLLQSKFFAHQDFTSNNQN